MGVVNMVNNNGQTPLHRAAVTGCPRAVEALLINGADPTLPDADGLKPARLAHIYSNYEIASLLAQAHVEALANNQGNGSGGLQVYGGLPGDGASAVSS